MNLSNLLKTCAVVVLAINSCIAQETPVPAKPAIGNPFITSMYTADPSAHVWKDGRMYVYASHDIAPARGCDLMDQYHVYSTDDMVHWKDHGEILRATDVEWGRPKAVLCGRQIVLTKTVRIISTFRTQAVPSGTAPGKLA
jgi:arabinoxylan arabinofuranohydrolase